MSVELVFLSTEPEMGILEQVIIEGEYLWKEMKKADSKWKEANQESSLNWSLDWTDVSEF